MFHFFIPKFLCFFGLNSIKKNEIVNFIHLSLTIVFSFNKQNAIRNTRCALVLILLFCSLMDRGRRRRRFFFPSLPRETENLRSISQNKLSSRRAEMTVTSLLFHSVLFLDCFQFASKQHWIAIAMRRMQVCLSSERELIHLNLLLFVSSSLFFLFFFLTCPIRVKSRE